MPMFNFVCQSCDHAFDDYLRSYKDPNSLCEKCGGKTQREFPVCAFTFADGTGTDGGMTMRSPGYRVPGDNPPRRVR